MRRQFFLFSIVFLLALSMIACTLTPQFIRSAPQEIGSQVKNEVATTISRVQIEEGGFTTLYKEINPGVVAIRALSEEGGGLGTGFVWDDQGHIVTNFHVVQAATDLEVDFPSGHKTRARVIGEDPDTDLAVLELDELPENLVVLSMGDAMGLEVGQTVIAIGNPRGLDGTMTTGIISALGRTLESQHFAPGGGAFATGNIIQTDAAINPGNSGGPLVNIKGEVIGINSAISTSNINIVGQPVNSGLGFAISIDTAKNVVPDLIAFGKHDSPYVGIQVLSEVSLFIQEELDLPQATGVYVLEVTEGSPAADAGIIGANGDQASPKGGDLIIGIDDQKVNNFEDFMGYLLTYKKPGDQVTIILIRDNETIEVEVALEKRP
jgi:2-alkenal reductase